MPLAYWQCQQGGIMSYTTVCITYIRGALHERPISYPTADLISTDTHTHTSNQNRTQPNQTKQTKPNKTNKTKSSGAYSPKPKTKNTHNFLGSGRNAAVVVARRACSQVLIMYKSQATRFGRDANPHRTHTRSDHRPSPLPCSIAIVVPLALQTEQELACLL